MQQGDPLGPLLFAIALQPIAADLRKRLEESVSSTDSPLLPSMWYLDYGYIIAKHYQLREAVASLLSNDVKASGLHLNLSKCHVWWPKEPTESAKAAYPTELSQEYTEGTQILNAPLGTHESMEDNIATKVKALESLFEMVASLEKAHVSFTLLKFCLGVCKINYLLSVTPVQCTKLGAQLFDKFLENGQRTIVGGCLTTNYSWNFNCLPKAAQTVRTRPLAWGLLPPSLPPLPHS